METVGRWTVGILFGTTVYVAQWVLRHFLGDQWTASLYEVAVFFAIHGYVGRRWFFRDKKPAATSAPERGGGRGRG